MDSSQYMPCSWEGRILLLLQLPLSAFLLAALIGPWAAGAGWMIALSLVALGMKPLLAGIAIRSVERRLERIDERPSLFAHEPYHIGLAGVLFTTTFVLILALFRSHGFEVLQVLPIGSAVYSATTLACLLGFDCAARERMRAVAIEGFLDPY